MRPRLRAEGASLFFKTIRTSPRRPCWALLGWIAPVGAALTRPGESARRGRVGRIAEARGAGRRSTARPSKRPPTSRATDYPFRTRAATRRRWLPTTPSLTVGRGVAIAAERLPRSPRRVMTPPPSLGRHRRGGEACGRTRVRRRTHSRCAGGRRQCFHGARRAGDRQSALAPDVAPPGPPTAEATFRARRPVPSVRGGRRSEAAAAWQRRETRSASSRYR